MYNDEFNGRVFVPPNIKNNKQEIFAKFDLRDITYIGVALGIFISVYLFLNKGLNVNNGICLVIGLILGMPVILAGFMKFDGVNFEEYIVILRNNKILASNVRINNSDNIYEILENEKIQKKDTTKETKIKKTNSRKQKNNNKLNKKDIKSKKIKEKKKKQILYK